MDKPIVINRELLREREKEIQSTLLNFSQALRHGHTDSLSHNFYLIAQKFNEYVQVSNLLLDSLESKQSTQDKKASFGGLSNAG